MTARCLTLSCPVALISMMLFAPHILAGEPQPRTLLVIEPTEQYPRNSEGDMVVLKDGSLLLAYTRFTTGGHDNSRADVVARTSPDGGRTWSDDRILVKNEGDENVMSVSILRLPSDELLLFYARKNGWNDCNLYVRRSSDEFKTLSDPVRCTIDPGYHVINNDRVLQLSSGRLLVPAALHLCPDGTQKTWTHHGISRVFYSDDAGKTWARDNTPVTQAPKLVYQEPGLLQLRSDLVWMWMRTAHGYQYDCLSRDGGLTWSPIVPNHNFASPTSPATIERIPWTGHLLAIWNDHSGRFPFPKGRRTPLCISISKDQGRTWSPSRVIESDPDGWYCYTAMIFTDTDAILAYCAGDKKVGGLNRLKLTALPKAWLYSDNQPTP